MNRSDFQQLADVRIDEAALLLVEGKYHGAYYLAGYAVECGLKACLAKLTDRHEFPPKPKSIHDYYSHEIEKLVKTAGLTTQRDADAAADPDLQANWGSSRTGPRRAGTSATLRLRPNNSSRRLRTPHTGCSHGSSNVGRTPDR